MREPFVTQTLWLSPLNSSWEGRTMTEKQKAVLEASDLELLDELKNGDLLVRDTEAMAIRGVYFCYILSKEGSVQNIDYYYRTRQAAKTA
jgi:hypothetical protein